MEVFSIIIAAYLGLSSLYMFIFACAAKLPASKKKSPKVDSKINSIAVLIPAYKEDTVIEAVAKSALEQDYPNYTVVIIADSFQKETLHRLAKLPITLIEVTFEKSTKAKALNFAMQQLDSFDTALILDADNIMEQGFLDQINKEYNKGYPVIQGCRMAKNTNSNFAVLDGISEAINNNIYNVGTIRLQLSSRLVGSGMLFTYNLLKSMMEEAEAVGGFDKELEIKLLKEGVYIHYAHHIRLWDEKVHSGKVFKKQRTRWIASQFFFLKKYGMNALKALLLKGNVDFFNKMIQMALPPRVLIPFMLAVGSVVHLFFMRNLLPLWTVGLLLNLSANFMSIPGDLYNKKMLLALFSIPKAVVMTFLSLLSLKKANKEFIHTPHDS